MEFLHSRLKIVEIVLRCLLVFVREGEKKEADAFDLWQNPRLLLLRSSSLRSTSSSVRKQIAECTSLKIPGFGSSGKLERSLESREEELEECMLLLPAWHHRYCHALLWTNTWTTCLLSGLWQDCHARGHQHSPEQQLPDFSASPSSSL